MTSITCGWCGDRCHMTPHGEPSVMKEPGCYMVDGAFTCGGCQRMSVATWATSDMRALNTAHYEGPGPYDKVRWPPSPRHQHDFEDVPDQIAMTAKEAWTCHVDGAHRGAVMLARAVVESTAKAKGATSGALEKKIQQLADDGLIRKAVAAQAHEIRHLGNSTAHGDLGSPVTPEDAEEVLELMGEVLNEVWQAPARAERLKAKRQQKQAAPSVSREDEG